MNLLSLTTHSVDANGQALAGDGEPVLVDVALLAILIRRPGGLSRIVCQSCLPLDVREPYEAIVAELGQMVDTLNIFTPTVNTQRAAAPNGQNATKLPYNPLGGASLPA